jgi:hypothetical protein
LKELEKKVKGGNMIHDTANLLKKDTADGLMDFEEAEKFRKELMDERTVFLKEVENNFELYSLCEH